jgi:hypothetical protein
VLFLSVLFFCRGKDTMILRATKAFAFMAALYSPTVLAQSITVSLEVTTNGCKEPNELQHLVCLPPGKEISGPPQFAVLSKAGGSSYTWSPHPTLQNCINVKLIAVPLGEDCINLGITKVCNCKGRGWISIRVTLTPR